MTAGAQSPHKNIEGIALLGTILLFAMAALAVGGILYREYVATTTVIEEQTYLNALTTGQEAYRLALPKAQAWHDDVVVTGVEAVWRQPASPELLRGKTNWVLYFYSPSAHQTRTLSVVGKTVQINQTNDTDTAPKFIDNNTWQVDSPQAIQTFLQNGGQTFLNSYPHANIHIQLHQAENGGAEWRIMGVISPGKPTMLFYVNALNLMN